MAPDLFIVFLDRIILKILIKGIYGLVVIQKANRNKMPWAFRSFDSF
ncbi:hypothetical protein SAMN05216498_0197 [Tenuibacillus multivorans]|uniref:Uncharacterized protein n=1 Tax=Tenuibacillus multivorans TaxID=237069 RepID=A0A1H0F9Q4_9BACI|nr:hypothetical protein SAMN05216498_0197 [Tenuibacillus multivorans]